MLIIGPNLAELGQGIRAGAEPSDNECRHDYLTGKSGMSRDSAAVPAVGRPAASRLKRPMDLPQAVAAHQYRTRALLTRVLSADVECRCCSASLEVGYPPHRSAGLLIGAFPAVALARSNLLHLLLHPPRLRAPAGRTRGNTRASR